MFSILPRAGRSVGSVFFPCSAALPCRPGPAPLAVACLLVAFAVGQPAFAADSAAAEPLADGPVLVYVLSGQSNMVGIGQVDGGGVRWGSEFIEPVLSVYPGEYDDPDALVTSRPAGQRAVWRCRSLALSRWGRAGGPRPNPDAAARRL